MPSARVLFVQYLEKEYAQESVVFYDAVSRFLKGMPRQRRLSDVWDREQERAREKGAPLPPKVEEVGAARFETVRGFGASILELRVHR